MKFYLIVAKGKHKGMPIPINIDLFMVGSAKSCQLRSQAPGIGAEQCALVSRDRKVFVRAMNSGGPTVLNGELVPPGEEWPIHAGDRLEVGDSLDGHPELPMEFMIQFREKPLSQRDLEEWAAKCLDVSSERELFDEEADEFHKATTASSAAASIIDKLQAQRGIVMGRLRIGREAGLTIVRFNDRHLIEEAEIALVKKELCQHLGRPNLRVLLDCKNVKRMSTAAVKMVDEVSKWLRQWGSSVALCRVREEIREILQTMDLAKVPLFHDKRAAMADRW